MLPLCLMPKNVTVCHSKNNCVQIPIRTWIHFLRFLALKIKSVWILKMSVHLKGLCRLSWCYYTHGCLLLFLSFARVVEWLWRSPWNWASGTPLTFASTRNNAELQWKEVIWDNALLKPTRKYARFVLLFANMYSRLYNTVEVRPIHAFIQILHFATHAIDITCISESRARIFSA